MASTPAHADAEPESVSDPEVRYVSAEEGRRMFDEVARAWTGLSGEEFIRRWEAGEYADIPDDAAHRHIVELVLMIPLARQDG